MNLENALSKISENITKTAQLEGVNDGFVMISNLDSRKKPQTAASCRIGKAHADNEAKWQKIANDCLDSAKTAAERYDLPHTSSFGASFKVQEAENFSVFGVVTHVSSCLAPYWHLRLLSVIVCKDEKIAKGILSDVAKVIGQTLYLLSQEHDLEISPDEWK